MSGLQVDVAIYRTDENVEVWFLPVGDYPNIINGFIAGLFDTVEDADQAASAIKDVHVVTIHLSAECDAVGHD